MTQRTQAQIKADKRAAALRGNLKKRKELKKTLGKNINKDKK